MFKIRCNIILDNVSATFKLKFICLNSLTPLECVLNEVCECVCVHVCVFVLCHKKSVVEVFICDLYCKRTMQLDYVFGVSCVFK